LERAERKLQSKNNCIFPLKKISPKIWLIAELTAYIG